MFCLEELSKIGVCELKENLFLILAMFMYRYLTPFVKTAEKITSQKARN